MFPRGFEPVKLFAGPSQRIFDIREQACDNPDSINEVPAVSADADSVKEKVIEAHNILMDLSDDNRERFQDLMAVLQQS